VPDKQPPSKPAQQKDCRNENLSNEGRVRGAIHAVAPEDRSFDEGQHRHPRMLQVHEEQKDAVHSPAGVEKEALHNELCFLIVRREIFTVHKGPR
jgi:hypothetical protein